MICPLCDGSGSYPPNCRALCPACRGKREMSAEQYAMYCEKYLIDQTEEIKELKQENAALRRKLSRKRTK